MSEINRDGLNRRKFLAGVATSTIAGLAAREVTGFSSRKDSPAAAVFEERSREQATSATDKQVRIGIVGGNFGSTFQWHLHPYCRVTAACDLRQDRADRLAKVYGAKSTYRSFREFLKHPELDAVGVFTPPTLHVWMATEAMKAGKHVISAVPAGMSVEELEQLIDCVKTTGMKYMMAETSYYRPEIITCRELAQQSQFGDIFYSEAEYHHEGLIPLMYDDRGDPTWRLGFAPMHYPTHCTGMIIPVTGERLVEVQAVGWGDGHEILQTNPYENPFWNTTAFFKTSGGHSSRISVFWHVAAGGTERSQFYGDRMSYIMERPEGSPNTTVRISKGGRTILDSNGYPEGDVESTAHKQPDHFEKLPPSMRVKTGHGNSHTFLTHEFISSIIENRTPAVDVYESVAYTMPGLIAHASALHDGEVLKIKDYGRAAS
jgi:predicted dehydrogenase